MSIIVKGMDMPTECRECLFNNFGTMSGETYCGVNGVTLAKKFETINFDGRPDWCPLVALPDKHGRLVEFIDVVTTLDEDSGTEEVRLGDIMRAYYEMRNAPTIVESEGE